MSRTLRLRHIVINQFIDMINKDYLKSPLPSQAILAETLNISRTTVRHVLAYGEQIGILIKKENIYFIKRKPTLADRIDDIIIYNDDEDSLISCEKHFLHLIHTEQLQPGDIFTEADFSQKAQVSILSVRKFLEQLGQYGLITNIKRGQWSMAYLDKDYPTQIFELREVLETTALKRFLTLPSHSFLWVKAKELLMQHRELQNNIRENYRHFSVLDRAFHSLILSSMNNPFFVQSFDLISIFFHYHYQWDDRDLLQRNCVAVSEHIIILQAMINKDETQAIKMMRHHLNTAKETMLNSLITQRIK